MHIIIINMSRVFLSELVSGMIQTWTAVSKTFILKVWLGSDAFALSSDSGKCHLPPKNMSVLGQVVLCGFLFCFVFFCVWVFVLFCFLVF